MFQDWNQIITGCIRSGVPTLQCIPAVLQNIVNAAYLFAGIVALLFIIYAGVRFMTSGGDQKQLEGARHILTYTIIGLIVILLSFLIINFISTIAGVDCIKFFGLTNCQ